VVGAAVGAAVAKNSNKKNADQPAVTPTTDSDTSQQIAELEKLGQLKDQGILTQEEFDAKKQQILGL
jgi:hypothetical protein